MAKEVAEQPAKTAAVTTSEIDERRPPMEGRTNSVAAKILHRQQIPMDYRAQAQTRQMTHEIRRIEYTIDKQCIQQVIYNFLATKFTFPFYVIFSSPQSHTSSIISL